MALEMQFYMVKKSMGQIYIIIIIIMIKCS